MAILYVVTNLFQLAIFLALTAVLFSIAAVSQMMEITIVHCVNPMTTFMLRQTCKIAILLVNQSARFTWRAYKKMCLIPSRSPLDQINLLAPEIPYSRSAIPGLVKETEPLAHDIDSSTIGEISIEPEVASTASADESTAEQPEEREESIAASS